MLPRDYQPGMAFEPYTFQPISKIWSGEILVPVAEVYGECMPGTFAFTNRYSFQENPPAEVASESYLAEIPNAREHFNSESGWGVIVYGYNVEVASATPETPYSISFYPYMGTLVDDMPGFNQDFASREAMLQVVNSLDLTKLTKEYLLAKGFTAYEV